MGDPNDISEIRLAVFEAIDRNRNRRQETILLTYAAALHRKHSEALREQKSGVGRALQNTLAQMIDQSDSAQEKPLPGQKKPVQSVKHNPKA